MRHALRRISPTGALFYGLLVGLCAWLLPGLALGWLARAAVLRARDWLGGLTLTIPLPVGEGIALDLTSALALDNTQARLDVLAAQETALLLAVSLGVIAAGMLLTGLLAMLSAVVYNIFAGVFGGVEIRLDALEAPPAVRPLPQRPAPAQGAPARPAPVAAAATGAAIPPAPQARPQQAQAPAAAAWLAPTDGGARRALRDGVTRVGSAPGNDIVLPGLAPQHAEIRRESGRYLIYDLGSRRTWVNESQVAAVHMLKNGFRLQMGQSEFIVHIPAANQAVTEG